MTEATTLSFRCPADILDAIRQAMTATGAKQSTVITDALRVGLGLAEAGHVGQALDTSRALQGITDRIADLEGTVRQHERAVEDLAQLAQRVRVLEDRVRFKAIPAEENKQPHAADAAAAKTNKPLAFEGPPTPTESPSGYLTRQQAFKALGGDLADPASKVPTLTGAKRVTWNTFRLAAQTDYSLFGFEVDEGRKAAGEQDWLVPTTRPKPAQGPSLFPEGV